VGSELVHVLRDPAELPSLRGWVEAMTSLGRLIFFDQPGTGASDPVTPGALPTLVQWADSITVVLDDLGSREAVLLAQVGGIATGALADQLQSSPRHGVATTG
jgi:pimeloyl-ACP methyl ester carboxylesterase